MEKIMSLSDYESDSAFTERERAALAYAEAMTHSERGVGDALFRRLLAVFSEDEIIELTALIGYQNLSSKFNAALSVPSQGFCLSPPKSK